MSVTLSPFEFLTESAEILKSAAPFVPYSIGALSGEKPCSPITGFARLNEALGETHSRCGTYVSGIFAP